MLTGIMNTGVLGVLAQSRAMSTISSNLANAQTVGFKASETQFKDVVARDRNGADAPGDGVRADERLLADQQGELMQTGLRTNVAINGAGFFVVQDLGKTRQGADVELTRAGDFTQDVFGHFVNSAGRALMGVKLTDGAPAGAAGAGALELITVSGLQEYQRATTSISLRGTLPSEAPIALSPTASSAAVTSVEVIGNTGTTDATGQTQSRSARVDLRIVKTGQDTATGTTSWALYNAGARDTDDGRVVGGHNPTDPSTWGAPLGSFVTDARGQLTGGTPGAAASVPLDLGPGFVPITINLGRYGEDEGISVSSGGTALSASQDGIPRGSLKDIGINDDGYVEARFADGKSRLLYKLMSGTVRNPQDLTAVSGTAFTPTRASGDLVLKDFGHQPSGAAGQAAGSGRGYSGGDLVSGSVETSTTNIEQQFTTMIVAQRTYSAASKIITAADEMTRTSLSMKA